MRVGAKPEVLQTLASGVASPPTDGPPPTAATDIPLERRGQYTSSSGNEKGVKGAFRAPSLVHNEFGPTMASMWTRGGK